MMYRRHQHATSCGELVALCRGAAEWPVRRRRRAGPADRKLLPYATSAWLRARRHRGPEQPGGILISSTRGQMRTPPHGGRYAQSAGETSSRAVWAREATARHTRQGRIDRRLLYCRMRRRAVVPYATATSGQPLPCLPPPMARTGVPADEGRTALPIFRTGTRREGVLCGSAPALYSSQVQQRARIPAHYGEPLRTNERLLTWPYAGARVCMPVSGGQGVAGSNPAVPTVFRTLLRHVQQQPAAPPATSSSPESAPP